VDGYDFVLHVGVGAKGALKVEKRARRWGYAQRDADGEQCEIGRDEMGDGDLPDPGPDNEREEAEAERFERERIRGAKWGADAYRRGFGQTYEGFEDELRTEIDAEALVDALRTGGFEVRI
jgi:pyroglutamyl-peptidase